MPQPAEILLDTMRYRKGEKYKVVFQKGQCNLCKVVGEVKCMYLNKTIEYQDDNGDSTIW